MLIGDKWKIETSRLNVTLYQKKKGRNGDYFKEAGFYSSIPEALDALVDLEVLGIELTDLRTIVAKIDEVKEMIREAVEKIPIAC